MLTLPPSARLRTTVLGGTVFPELVSKRMSSLEPEIADIALYCVERSIELEGPCRLSWPRSKRVV